jgi:hypothetical protein
MNFKNGAALARGGLLQNKRMFLAWRSIFHSYFKFLHKYYLLLGNIKIVIAFVGSIPVLLSKRFLILKIVENLRLPSVGVLLFFYFITYWNIS